MDFADVIKVGLDMGKGSGWAQFNHKGHYKKKAGGPKSRGGKVMTETEIRVMGL